jgi:hypothetical protein
LVGVDDSHHGRLRRSLPTTVAGRFIAAGLMLAAFAFLGIVTESFVSWLLD